MWTSQEVTTTVPQHLPPWSISTVNIRVLNCNCFYHSAWHASTFNPLNIPNHIECCFFLLDHNLFFWGPRQPLCLRPLEENITGGKHMGTLPICRAFYLVTRLWCMQARVNSVQSLAFTPQLTLELGRAGDGDTSAQACLNGILYKLVVHQLSSK